MVHKTFSKDACERYKDRLFNTMHVRLYSVLSIKIIIIHSKYFPDSDWLKAHTYFTITSYRWLNLEEFCNYSTDDVKKAAFLLVNAPLTKKTWGRGWVFLVVKTKMADISLVWNLVKQCKLALKKSHNLPHNSPILSHNFWFFITLYQMAWTTLNVHYYSFKIFPQFWLAKSTLTIHHKQLLMTKFGRILCLMRKWRKKCSLLQVKAPLPRRPGDEVEFSWLWKQKWWTLHSKHSSWNLAK